MSQDFSLTSFPNLETRRLLLRQATQENIEAVFAVFSDPQVTKFNDLEMFNRLDEASRIIERRAKGFENGRGIRWAITCKENNYLIGSCGFTWLKEINAAEIGYELKSQFWKQGIMSEALSDILQYGFSSREIEFVIAEVMLENLASKKLLEKVGFQSQGILEKRGFWKGKHHDLEQFKLTETEFMAT
ncbi:GNAT family N-acetyltransferase [Myxosarcina sp. GI1(2024)]